MLVRTYMNRIDISVLEEGPQVKGKKKGVRGEMIPKKETKGVFDRT